MLKKSRKIMAMFTLLTLIVGSFSFAAYDPLKPVLGVVASDEIQVIKVGEKSEYKISIKNQSSTAATNVKVTIQGNHPFRSDVSGLTKTFMYLNPNTTTELVYTVTPSPLAESKIYEFDVLLEYSNFEDGAYSETQKVYVKIENSAIEPILGIYEYNFGEKPLEAGVPVSLALKIRNTGTLKAKDVKVSLSGFSNEGVVLSNETDTKTFTELNNKETKLIYFNIVAGKDAKEGTFPLNVVITYIDDLGNTYKKESIVYVTLAGKAAVNSDLIIKNVKYPTSVNANSTFEVSFLVENTGTAEITSADVSYQYPESFISKAASKVVVKNLKPGATQMITFKLMPKAETTTENYHTYINVSYVAKGAPVETPQTAQEYVGIYVIGKAEEGEGSKPKLIIDHYDYGGDYVYAGQDYPLTIRIKNTSQVEGTRNIKVTLTSEENVFTPVDSSSSFFIQSVGPGQVYEHTVYLKTKIDANVKIYTLTAKMQYEDSKGNAYDANKTPYEESEVLSVAVAQPVRLETADVIIPFEIYAGQPFYIEQEFYNMGKSTMFNMMVKLEGVETNEGSYFVGNFEAGKSEYFSAQVTPFEIGTFEGKLVYTFEDALGSVSTVEQPFSYTVIEMPTWDDGNGGIPIDPGLPVEPEKKIELWKIIVGALLGLAVVAFIVRKILKAKKRKKELEDLDE